MDIIRYIFNLRISDIPLHIAYVGIIAMIGYCASMMIIGIPCSIVEAITKREILKGETKDKIIRAIAICLDAVLLVILLYELSTEN